MIYCLLIFVPLENISLTLEVTIARERASTFRHTAQGHNFDT